MNDMAMLFAHTHCKIEYCAIKLNVKEHPKVIKQKPMQKLKLQK